MVLVQVMEILENNYFIIFYGIALVYSIVKYKFYFDTPLRFFPIIIGYTLLSEILGYFIRDFEGFQLIYMEGYSYYNQLIYNIFDIIFFLYFYYVFWHAVSKDSNKKLIKYGSIFFIVASVINPFFQDIMIFPQLLAIIAGSILLLLSIVLYLLEGKSQVETKKRSNLMFWICIGLFVFYIFYPIIMAMGVLDYDLYKHFGLHGLLRILITFMYGCFIIGFARLKRPLVL